MKQIVDKLNDISEKMGGERTESNLIVDALEEIEKVAASGGGGSSESVTLYFNAQEQSTDIHTAYKDRTLAYAYTTYDELKNDIAGKNVIFKGILGNGVEITCFPYSLYDVYVDDEQYTYFYSVITMIMDGRVYPVDIGVRAGGK